MSTKRTCLACQNIDVDAYLRVRMAKGANVRSISAELADRDRMDGMGYKRPPGPTMLEEHVRKHISSEMVPVSGNMPSFSTPMAASEVIEDPRSDIAIAIQRKGLEMLERGELRITATNALKAQEMLDRRAEKQRDRELMLVLARVLTREAAPPPKYVGMAERVEIEAQAEEV